MTWCVSIEGEESVAFCAIDLNLLDFAGTACRPACLTLFHSYPLSSSTPCLIHKNICFESGSVSASDSWSLVDMNPMWRNFASINSQIT